MVENGGGAIRPTQIFPCQRALRGAPDNTAHSFNQFRSKKVRAAVRIGCQSPNRAFTGTGACLATLPWTYKDRASYVVGNLGSLLYPIGIILTFIQDGWILGILSIIIGFIAYDYARR